MNVKYPEVKVKPVEITEAIVRKVLETVDAGLVQGVGSPEPGKMCVEAAVCYALGLPHGDDPACVSRALRSLKIRLNDAAWSSTEARAKGLRRLAIAQLGSRDAIDDREFARRVAELAIRTCVPTALRGAASVQDNAYDRAALIAAANKCEKEGTYDSAMEARTAAADAAANADDAAAYAAYAAADAAYAAYAVNAVNAADAAYDAAAYAAYAADAAYAATMNARDAALASFAEGVVQILIEMKAPGCQWLAITEAA